MREGRDSARCSNRYRKRDTDDDNDDHEGYICHVDLSTFFIRFQKKKISTFVEGNVLPNMLPKVVPNNYPRKDV